MDSQDIKKIIQQICTHMKETPNSTIIRDIITFIKKHDISFLYNKYPDRKKRIQHLSNEYIKYVSKEDNKDVSEINKDLLENIIINDDYIKYKHINKNAHNNWNITNIYIDSRYQNISNYNREIIDFTIIPKSNTSKNSTGSLISYSNLTNITEFEIGSFIIPYKNLDTNYYKEITLTFINMINNSIESNEQSFHFKFLYEVYNYGTGLVKLIPYDRKFRFNPPIKTLDNLKIQFADPYIPIQFDKDRLKPSSIDYSLSVGKFIFDEDHNLSTGDVVIITDLITTNDNENIELLKKINNPRGHLITVLTSQTFTIDIPFNTIMNPLLSCLPIVYFHSKRIQFPIKIKYINTEEEF